MPIKTGSWGNCIYLDFDGEQRTILDSGVEMSIVKKALRPYYADNFWVNHFVSHPHGDHCKYEKQFENAFRSELSELTVVKFELPHDGVISSTAHIIQYEDQSVLWMTDFNTVTKELADYVKGKTFDLVLIEANYCEKVVAQRRRDSESRTKKSKWFNHHSVEKTLAFLDTFEWTYAEFIHLSQQNIDIDELDRLIGEFKMSEKNSWKYGGWTDYVEPDPDFPIYRRMKYANRNDRKVMVLDALEFTPPKEFKNKSL